MTMTGSRWKSDAAAGGTQDALELELLLGSGRYGAWRLVRSGLAAESSGHWAAAL